MTHLLVDPSVLAALRSAKPKPPKNARRAITKHVELLAEEIELSKQRPRSVYDVKNNIYTIDVSRIYKQGGQFGDHGQRLLTWLRENNLELFTFHEKGNNFIKRKSKVTLTKLVTEIKPGSSPTNLPANVGLADRIEVSIQNADKVAARYTAIQQRMTSQQIVESFHSVPVDMESLQNYIDNLGNSKRIYPTHVKELYATQAAYIKQLSQCFNGQFQQHVTESQFGRNYYVGTSIQNINKELRSAVLGNCWEYDVTSSATAWKMSHADAFLTSINSTESLDDAFSVTIGFLTEKPVLMGEIQDYTFANCNFTPLAEQLDLIKRAMNALCFGARLKTKGWRFGVSDDEKPALCKIFEDQVERERFVNCPFVKQFVREQNNLDTYLFQEIKTKQPELLNLPWLRTAKRASKSKVVAMLYQTAETENMAKIYEYLASQKITVLAKVHDAFFVREQLTAEQLQTIESEMQRITGIKYFKLHATQIHRCLANAASTPSISTSIPTPSPSLLFQIEVQVAADELSILGKRDTYVDSLYAQGGFKH